MFAVGLVCLGGGNDLDADPVQVQDVRLLRLHRVTPPFARHSSATASLNTYAQLWPTAEVKTRAAASGLAAAVLATPLPHMKAP